MVPNTFSLSEENVPLEYRDDPLSDVNAKYNLILLTKFDPDEKDISEIQLPSSKESIKYDENGKTKDKLETRVGWLIPAISLLSREHNYFNNTYFRKHAYEIFKVYNEKTIDERSYFLIYSQGLEKKCAFTIHEGIISLGKYGIYFLSGQHANHLNTLSEKIKSKTTLSRYFDIYKAKGFIQSIFHEVLQTEKNPYARFMFLYQIIELLMELTFYSKIDSFRNAKNHLGAIRKKIEEYSSEDKLISSLYTDCRQNIIDQSLVDKCNDLLPQKIHAGKESKSVAIYSFRNAIVHNYFRLNAKLDMFFPDYLEMDIYNLFEEIFSRPNLEIIRSEFQKSHLS